MVNDDDFANSTWDQWEWFLGWLLKNHQFFDRKKINCKLIKRDDMTF